MEKLWPDENIDATRCPPSNLTDLGLCHKEEEKLQPKNCSTMYSHMDLNEVHLTLFRLFVLMYENDPSTQC